MQSIRTKINSFIPILVLLALVTGIFFMNQKKEEGTQLGTTVISALPEKYRNGAWVWESPKSLNEEKVKEMLDFAKDKNIQVIYLFIEDYLSIIEDPKVKDKTVEVEEFNSKVKTIIALANERDIEVEALAGDVNWADSSHKYIAPTFVDYVLDFNSKASEDEKFVGIQFDIEFYNKENFKKDKVTSTKDFLSLVSSLSSKVKGNNIQIGFAVPYWVGSEGGVAPKVIFNKKEKTVLEHMLDILRDTNSYLVLMSYRNHATGNNGSIEISQKAIDLADKSTVHIYIGQETEKNEVKSITFYGMNQSELHKSAEEIASAFSNSKSFSGISIHTLTGYKSLKGQ